MRHSLLQNCRGLPCTPGGSSLPQPARLQRTSLSPAGTPASAGISAVVVMADPPCISFRFASFRFASRPARARAGRGRKRGSGDLAAAGHDVIAEQRAEEGGGNFTGPVKKLARGRAAGGGQLVGVALVSAPCAAAASAHTSQLGAEQPVAGVT